MSLIIMSTASQNLVAPLVSVPLVTVSAPADQSMGQTPANGQMATGQTVSQLPASPKAQPLSQTMLARVGSGVEGLAATATAVNEKVTAFSEDTLISPITFNDDDTMCTTLGKYALYPARVTDMIGSGFAIGTNVVFGALFCCLKKGLATTISNVIAVIVRIAVTAGVGLVAYAVGTVAGAVAGTLLLLKLILKDLAWDTILVKGLYETVLKAGVFDLLLKTLCYEIILKAGLYEKFLKEFCHDTVLVGIWNGLVAMARYVLNSEEKETDALNLIKGKDLGDILGTD